MRTVSAGTTSVPHPRTPARTASAVLADTHALVAPALRGAVDQLPASLRSLAGYHFGWWNDKGEPTTASSGKGIRAALVLRATAAVCGTMAEGLPAAVAVELSHNATLLHDDLIDEDHTRRHRPTTWSVFGAPAAILAGDALFFLAIHALQQGSADLREQGVTWLSATMLQLIDGEYADTVFERRDDVTLDECQAMAIAKTGALIENSCALGALAGAADPPTVEHLRTFGRHLGIAFQLVDDLMGIWGDPARTGKPRMSDLHSRKKSLPVVAALSNTTHLAARKLADLYCDPRPLTDAELLLAAELVEQAGGRAWAVDEAGQHVDSALTALAAARLDPASTSDLETLARLITDRDN